MNSLTDLVTSWLSLGAPQKLAPVSRRMLGDIPDPPLSSPPGKTQLKITSGKSVGGGGRPGGIDIQCRWNCHRPPRGEFVFPPLISRKSCHYPVGERGRARRGLAPWRSPSILPMSIRQLSLHVREPEGFPGCANWCSCRRKSPGQRSRGGRGWRTRLALNADWPQHQEAALGGGAGG